MIRVVLLCALFGVSSGFHHPLYNRTTTYENERVLRCELNSATAAAVDKLGLDDWGVSSGSQSKIGDSLKDATIDVRVANAAEEKALRAAAEGKCIILVDNVETLVRNWEDSLISENGEGWFEKYHPFEELIAWYGDAAKNHPEITEFVKSIGKTYEGRDLSALHITSKNVKTLATKPKVYFQCNVHAREWITSAVCNYIVNHILENYGKDARITKIVDTVELVIVPVTNPDGFSYSWSNSRLWRKNRGKNAGSNCQGVDVNRNFPDHWGQGGSSDDPCSDVFMGASAGSELETQTVISYFKSLAPVVAAVDWHSYSQLVLRPYGWTKAEPPHEKLVKEVADGMRDKIKAVSGVEYSSIASIELYITTGSAGDWFFGEATKINKGTQAYGYTLELRDTGRYGFLLPPNQIIPTGEEMLAAALYYIEFTTQNPLQA